MNFFDIYKKKFDLIFVLILISQLPKEARIYNNIEIINVLSVKELLLCDIYQSFCGEEHPLKKGYREKVEVVEHKDIVKRLKQLYKNKHAIRDLKRQLIEGKK